MTKFDKGDRVSWGTPQGTTQGTVLERRTSEFEHDGQKFKASDDEPYYLVESEKSGSKVAHKEGTLRAIDDA